jgi:3-hydroxy-9,10-secoandrosta-1,3,5(10)-triene-9,17-dione monooxygenase reductase component
MREGVAVTMAEADCSQADFRRTLGGFCTGVVIVTGWEADGAPAGFTAQSLVALSLDPPLIGISPARTSRSWPRIRPSGRFCVNILGVGQTRLSAKFAGSDPDRFTGEAWRGDFAGGPTFGDVVGRLDCRVVDEHDVGDHTLVVGRVLCAEASGPEVSPLLYCRGALGTLAGLPPGA